MEGENSGVEGVGQYFPGRPSPLDVLMHVENNLTANLLHSFSFLPGLSPPCWTCHPFLASLTAHLPDPSLLLYPRPRVVERLVSSLFRRLNRPPLDPRPLVCPFSRSSNDRPPTVAYPSSLYPSTFSLSRSFLLRCSPRPASHLIEYVIWIFELRRRDRDSEGADDPQK